MCYPKSVLKILKSAATKYPEDFVAGPRHVESELRKLTEFEPTIKNLLIARACLDMFEDWCNALSLCDRRIDGRAMGSMLGKELEAIAAAEADKRDEHAFNVRLCNGLRRSVLNEERVQDVVHRAVSAP